MKPFPLCSSTFSALLGACFAGACGVAVNPAHAVICGFVAIVFTGLGCFLILDYLRRVN